MWRARGRTADRAEGRGLRGPLTLLKPARPQAPRSRAAGTAAVPGRSRALPGEAQPLQPRRPGRSSA